MQEFKIYVSASSAVGEVRDFANAQSASLPELVRGIEAVLKLRLFASPDESQPYPIHQLKNIASWQWVMDNDFNEETNYILVADNDNITVSTVQDVYGDVTYTYTEIAIPLPNTNTVELDKWLGNGNSKSGLIGELVGYNTNGDSVFVLQLENFTFRNRLTSSGNPTDLPSEYLTESQVRAVITGTLQNPFEFEFSVNKASWHTTQTDADMYYRQRISNINAEWSTAIKMIAGPPVDTAEIEQYIDEKIDAAFGNIETQLSEI